MLNGHVNLSYQLSNLGHSLLCHFTHTGDVPIVDEGIKLQRQAVTLAPTDLQSPSQLSNLGNSLRVQFKHTGDLVDIDNAQQEAVALTPVKHITNLIALLHSL